MGSTEVALYCMSSLLGVWSAVSSRDYSRRCQRGSLNVRLHAISATRNHVLLVSALKQIAVLCDFCCLTCLTLKPCRRASSSAGAWPATLILPCPVLGVRPQQQGCSPPPAEALWPDSDCLHAATSAPQPEAELQALACRQGCKFSREHDCTHGRNCSQHLYLGFSNMGRFHALWAPDMQPIKHTHAEQAV
jgi:hypothetical protein